MKSRIITVIIAVWSLTSLNSQAQSAAEIRKTEQAINRSGKYGLLVMKVPQLKAAIRTGIELKSKSDKIDFQILTCGGLVKEIAQDQALQELVTDAVNNKGLKILVCGLSVQQFKVDKSLLPKAAALTENGLIYMLGLQEQGYKTITL